MATSKGRGGAAQKPAASKKSAPPSKSSAGGNRSKDTSPARSGSKSATPAARNSAPVKAAAKNTASRNGTATKATAARGGAATKAAAAPPARNGKTAAAPASRGAAVKATPSRGAAPAPARKAAAPAARNTSAAASRNTPARGGASRTKTAPASADPRNDLEKILQDLMKDIYYAEKKLSKALVKMAKSATDPKLKEAFTTHQTQTDDQVSKLEEAFGLLGYPAKAKKCAAMDGLLEEANEHISEYKKGAGLDAAMIVGAQKVEHYEIAAYGSMRSFAKTLGYEEAAAIFEEIREQESDTDELLTTLAESVINLKAEEETEDIDNDEDDDAASDGNEDSESGEDSSSATADRNEGNREGGDDALAGDADDDAGSSAGVSGMTDGNDRNGASETGEAMGY